MDSKEITFTIMMGALGNILAVITIIPTMVQQVALDFSAVPIVIAGVFGGPVIGSLTGLIAGILPSIFFGYIGGQLGILGFTTCIGKAVHGLTVGLMVRYFRPLEKSTVYLIPITLLSFIPESVWIYLVFTSFVPLFLPHLSFLSGIVGVILVKAWFEIAVISFFVAALSGHKGFESFVGKYLSHS